ncbi:MAG TPA: hypothetical protein DCY56_04540 [Candidatus Omnitrophica bacterium]|nr:hypothetical protein [Candidatus Omnitrophota bacterium]
MYKKGKTLAFRSERLKAIHVHEHRDNMP